MERQGAAAWAKGRRLGPACIGCLLGRRAVGLGRRTQVEKGTPMPIPRPESDTNVPLFLSLLNLSLRSPFPGPTFLPSCPFFLLLRFLLLFSDLEEDLWWTGWHPKRHQGQLKCRTSKCWGHCVPRQGKLGDRHLGGVDPAVLVGLRKPSGI